MFAGSWSVVSVVCVVCVCFLFVCVCLSACARLCVLTNQSFHISACADIRKLQQLSDGTCNAIPAWEITLNPQSAKNDPDCKAFPFYDELGLGDGASYGGGKVLRVHLLVPSSHGRLLPRSFYLCLSLALSLSRSLAGCRARYLSHTLTSLTLSYSFLPRS